MISRLQFWVGPFLLDHIIISARGVNNGSKSGRALRGYSGIDETDFWWKTEKTGDGGIGDAKKNGDGSKVRLQLRNHILFIIKDYLTTYDI